MSDNESKKRKEITETKKYCSFMINKVINYTSIGKSVVPVSEVIRFGECLGIKCQSYIPVGEVCQRHRQ